MTLDAGGKCYETPHGSPEPGPYGYYWEHAELDLVPNLSCSLVLARTLSLPDTHTRTVHAQPHVHTRTHAQFRSIVRALSLVSLSPSFSLFLSPSLSLYLSISLARSLSHSLTLSLSLVLSRARSRARALSLSLSLSHSLLLSLCRSVSLSFALLRALSFFRLLDMDDLQSGGGETRRRAGATTRVSQCR